MRGTVGPLSLAWLVAAGAAGGCSFFDEVGGANLKFSDLPVARDFKINSTDSRWWPCRRWVYQTWSVAARPRLVSDCCQPPAPMLAVDCQEYPLSCDPADGYCALAFDYDDAVEIDLGATFRR